MKRPQSVRANANVGVFAPSSPFSDDRFQKGLDRLKERGFRVTVHAQAYEKAGFLAGDDRTRLAAFHDLLSDGSIDALMAARGGYGAHRFVDQIDFDLVKRAEKPIIGFSDICAIHSAVQRRADLHTIHGPVVTQLSDLGVEDLDAFVRVLSGEIDGYSLASDRPPICGGQATGRVVGGCLSVIVPLVGSSLLYIPDGAILVLEDVTEAPYRIDRMLTHLRLSGALARIGGIALGDFVGCDPPRQNEQTVDEVLRERLGDLGVPVIAALPIGHGTRNRAFPLGAIATLNADQGRLIFHAS